MNKLEERIMEEKRKLDERYDQCLQALDDNFKCGNQKLIEINQQVLHEIFMQELLLDRILYGDGNDNRDDA